MSLTEEVIGSQTVFDGEIFDLVVKKVRLPNGAVARREIVEHNGAVGMVPIADNGDLILVRQYRLPVERELLEIPAGRLEPGEEPLDCARRELQEEIGYFPNSLEHLTTVCVAPGYSGELIHLYLARDLTPSRLSPDEDEFVDLVRVSFGEALEMIDSGEIVDSKTLIALMLVARRYPDLAG